jgi:hypothetical protein
MRRRRELGRHVADMLAVIANLTDPADTAMSGRFKRDNREVLEQIRQGDREAWPSVEHRLCDRDANCGNQSMNRRTGAREKDETVTLSRIIADCVQAHAFSDKVAKEVMGRLRSVEIDVVSR